MPIELCLPGEFNIGNATVALAAAAVLGIDPADAAAAFKTGRDRRVAVTPSSSTDGTGCGCCWPRTRRAGPQTLPLLDPASALLLVVNAREADGRDTSWLWDVPFERLDPAPVASRSAWRQASGQQTSAFVSTTPASSIAPCPTRWSRWPECRTGDVDVVANYTAFLALSRRITRSPR